MSKKHNDTSALDIMLSYKSIRDESIVLIAIQLVYIAIGSYLDVKQPYILDVFLISIIALALLAIFFLFILIESFKCSQWGKRKLSSTFKKIISTVFFRTITIYGIVFVGLFKLLTADNYSWFLITLNVTYSIFIILSLLLAIDLNCRAFIDGFRNEIKHVTKNNLVGINLNNKYDNKNSEWNFMIFLLASIFVVYSIFLMYKEGTKGQIPFFSNFVGIIATVFITNHFTDKKLNGSRKNEFRNSLYFEDYKMIHGAIDSALNVSTLANDVKFRIGLMKKKKQLYLNNIQSTNTGLEKRMERWHKAYEEFSIRYEYLLNKSHNNISEKCGILDKESSKLINYYNTDIVTISVEEDNYNNILALFPRLERVEKALTLLVDKLCDINKEYKDRVK